MGSFIYSLKKKMLSSVYCKLETMLCTEALQINLKNCIKQQHMSYVVVGQRMNEGLYK